MPPLEKDQSLKLRIPVRVPVGTVAPSFPLSQMLRFPFFSDLIFLPFFSLKNLNLFVRDAQWGRDGPVGADIVKWALDEAYVVKQRRSGEMGITQLNWTCDCPSGSSGRASVT